jgi:hypothetical protein
MAVVRNTLQEPGGAPSLGGLVSIRLASDGFLTDAQAQVVAYTSVIADPVTGAYEVDLPANDSIDPPGTHFVASHPDGSSWPFVVPAGDGPFCRRTVAGAGRCHRR